MNAYSRWCEFGPLVGCCASQWLHAGASVRVWQLPTHHSSSERNPGPLFGALAGPFDVSGRTRDRSVHPSYCDSSIHFPSCKGVAGGESGYGRERAV